MSPERIKAMITIVNRGEGIALSRLYTQSGVPLHTQITAHGTASSELLSIIGLANTERDMLVSFAAESRIDSLLDCLADDYRDILSVRGIAFSLNLTGISNSVAAALSPSVPDESKGGSAMPAEKEHNLILVVLNQGYTDVVMHTACAAGATGGTVIRGRWVGAEVLEQFHAITLQDEKEVLAIACLREKRNAIMDAINARHGLNTPQEAVICSLPIDRMIRLK